MDIKRKSIKFVSGFIPKKKWRKDFRNYFLHSDSQVYGRVYPPIYDMGNKLEGLPDIYNGSGQKMELFFLRDKHMATHPYAYPPPTYFMFDRYNIGLDVHFYTHDAMLERMGSPSRRYGMLNESESIVPNDYNIFRQNKGLEKEFTAIFTYSDKILNEVDNAKFLPTCSVPWYGSERGGGIIDESNFMRKTKNISIVSSSKTMCGLHDFRIRCARRCKNEGLADAFGTFDGGRTIKIAESLSEYRYTIAVENHISPYFFTEKITNCFLSMTIPIYLGASKIGEFFNEDGIIFLSEKDDIKKVLSQCCEKDYLSRLSAIKDNYNRVMEYRNVWDLMYTKYINNV